MDSESFTFPETVPNLEPALMTRAFHYAVETVFGENGLNREIIRASVDWRLDKTPAEKELDYGTDLSNAFVNFFSGKAMLVYAAIVRTFSMLALIDEGIISKEFLDEDDRGNIVVSEKILNVAAQLPLEAKQGFERQVFLSALKAVDQ
jgi:hypothetical protein